ncbi:MAG: T9SS type A sorting domain-containing protein [Candidatus Eisenbacteria bacterium]|uniref:T9SS type A sorting domain-containing protein n=1 Tax=Eiseniibacteriota bacterium TaxID=2212470 RepID=A0A956NAW1_UNCEI|nr:T9SS type A sorting domain-containing protein [Candidatus Eisenbacteria bacterium]
MAIAALCVAGTAWSQVSGFVREAGTAVPIEGALVTLQATDVRVVTAADGSFDLAGAVGSGIKIVAAHQGHYNRSIVVTTPSSGVEIALDPVPQADNLGYDFVSPSTCGVCHPDQYSQWLDSPMQKAGTNTWVYDIYDGSGTPGGGGGFVYTRDSRFAAENPASECASCHQPEPWIAEPFIPLVGEQPPPAEVLHGISCEVCHKIANIDESKPNFPGIFPGVTTLTRPEGSDQVQYGVLGDTDYSLPGLMRPSYQPQLVAHVCAACHQDKNDPDGDHDFEEANGIISEPTYLEWLDSPYGDPGSSLYTTCVDCHMPPYGATRICALPDGVDRDPETIRHHRIEGTTAEYLENSVELDLDCVRGVSTVDVQVRISNTGVGHHVPTGVTVRNMILRVEAMRESDGTSLPLISGPTVHALGGVGDPALGYFAGEPGKLFAKVNRDSVSGASPTFFTEATEIVFDTRIPALAADTSDFVFATFSPDEPIRIRARLVYRRAWRAVVDAKGWTEDGHGNPLEDISPPYYGHLMEEAEWLDDPSGVGDSSMLPSGLAVSVRPNPMRGPGSTVRLAVPEGGSARVALYDATGRHVLELLEDEFRPGVHEFAWPETPELPGGTYLVQLRSGTETSFTRVIVLP